MRTLRVVPSELQTVPCPLAFQLRASMWVWNQNARIEPDTRQRAKTRSRRSSAQRGNPGTRSRKRGRTAPPTLVSAPLHATALVRRLRTVSPARGRAHRRGLAHLRLGSTAPLTRSRAMSDEAAFLEVLKANPADDTARLVYADWLDEHDEPAKAEYLRLVARLPLVGDDVDVSSPKRRERTRSGPIAGRLESSSNRSVRRCVLDSRDKIRAIKHLRSFSGTGLRLQRASWNARRIGSSFTPRLMQLWIT